MSTNDVGTIMAALGDHGFPAEDLVPIKTGKHNTTYLVTLADPGHPAGDRVIVRIAPADDAGFLFYEQNMMSRERALHEEVMRKTDLPVPEIFVYDDTRNRIDRSFMIMEFMPGEPLSELQLDEGEERSVMHSVGKYLGQLHAKCRADSFGYPGDPRAGRGSWSDAFSDMWERLVLDIESCGVYTAVEAARVRDAQRANEDIFARDARASLLHMDIWGQNVLINERAEVTALLDWDRALWGDPEIEFAILDYVGFDTPDFWRGYGSMPPAGAEARFRAKFYHLYEVQKYLVIWTLRGGGSPARIRQYRDHCLGIIDEL